VLPEGDIRIVSPGGMVMPSDVEVIERPDGESLFLADWIAWREYDTVTGELRSTRHGTWWPGTLTNPDTIAPFGDYLLLASSENKQIQIWDPVQQKEVLLINYPGVDNAIGFDDAIVAAGFETKDVVRIDPKDPDQRTVLAGGFEYPLGLAADAGNLYVGDFLAGQILQVTADGVTLDSPKLIVEGLEGPEGLALTGDGRLLVVESGADRLSIVDLSSGKSTPLATDLGIMRDVPRSRPLHFFFNGVDVSPSGVVYVTADDANAIYRIPLPKSTSELDDATESKLM
jgi:sugar lactone lactonase YvrE